MWLLTVGVGVSAAETDSSIDAAAMSEVNLIETMVASRCDGSRLGSHGCREPAFCTSRRGPMA